jgi:flagella basal body P-ring formation protein FlgA
LSQLQVFIILATNVLLAARLTYQNAVQAAVAYGEQIKTAFDLYRWKALEGLNLQLPPNLKEERKLWGQVCGLLYRNYSPDFNYYRYVKQTNTKDPEPELSNNVHLPVPTTLLPPYRPILANDIAEKEIPEAQIPTDAVRQRDELTGRCPLQPLTPNQPISRSILVEAKYLTDTIAVGIQATPAMTLGGRLKAGDIADILLVSDEGATSTTLPTSIVWENILILDVRSVTALNDYPFVVVIALPKTLEKEFASVHPQARWLIASKC